MACKTLITLFAAVLTLASCGNNEQEAVEEQPRNPQAPVVQAPRMPVEFHPTPIPGGMEFNNTYSKEAIDSILRLPIADRPQTPKAAADYYLTVPPKFGVAPPTIPAKNIRVESESDSVAVIAYEAQHNPAQARLELFKASNGTDHAWLIRKTTMIHGNR